MQTNTEEHVPAGPLLGGMQEKMLLVSDLITFAEKHHPDTEVVSRISGGGILRCSWADVARRARQVACRLDHMGIGPSARVGTLAWNGHRHLELYYGVSGSGRVLHTINPRLHADQVAWIVNHAGDEVLMFESDMLALVRAIHDRCPSVRQYVLLCDEALPLQSGVPGLVSYEDWIAGDSARYEWPLLDERAACALCYTSGTTGEPKGVLYSHRSTILHAYAAALPDSYGISARDVVLPVVPMFHANAWGVPYVAALTGCKLVLPGSALDGPSLHTLMETEGVTFAAGVPTVWQMLLTHVQGSGLRFGSLKRTVIGGSACSTGMIQAFDALGVEVVHAWGMTELSPLGTVNAMKRRHQSWPLEERLALRRKQGRALFGVDLRLVDDAGKALPNDGSAPGHLQVRGPWVVRQYYRAETSALVDGWFSTGDVASIDADGYMEITDRSKDLIKSGGEWISSIAIENIAAAHPEVNMAACIAVKHPKWDERPVLVVLRRPGAQLTGEALLEFMAQRLPKWQVPDAAVFLEEMPVGATGKILKNRLRDLLRE